MSGPEQPSSPDTRHGDSRARASLGATSAVGSRGWLDLALPVVFLVLLVFAAVSSDTFLTAEQHQQPAAPDRHQRPAQPGHAGRHPVGRHRPLGRRGRRAERHPRRRALRVDAHARGDPAGHRRGGLVGLVNGGIIARFKIAPFIVTLGSLSAVRGLVYVISETPVVYDDPGFLGIGSAMLGPVPVITAPHARGLPAHELLPQPHHARPGHHRHRRQRGGGAAGRHQRAPQHDAGLRHLLHPGRDRGRHPRLARGHLAAQRGRRATSSTPSPPASSAAPSWAAAAAACAARSPASSSWASSATC